MSLEFSFSETCYLTKVKEPSLPNYLHCQVGWVCKIYRLHLCREITPTHTDYPDYDTDGEALVMQITPSLPSLPGPLLPRVVAPDRVKLKCLTFKLCTYAKLNCLKLNCFYI